MKQGIRDAGCLPLHSHVWHSKNGPHDPWSWEVWVESSAGLGAALAHMLPNSRPGIHLCAHADTNQEYVDHAARLCWVGAADPLDIRFFAEAPPSYKGVCAGRVSSPSSIFSMGEHWPRREDGTVDAAAYGAVKRTVTHEQPSGEDISRSAAVLSPLFLPHGAPPIPIERCTSEIWLQGVAARLPTTPRAIIFMSPHFKTSGRFAVSTSPMPEIIYDFDADTDPAKLKRLTKLQYRCPGAPDVARRAAELLRAAGLACDEDQEQGLDHGVWTPLYLMFPEADVPVCCVSVRDDLSAEDHLRAGRALRHLIAEGVLICGSGEVVHNVPLMGPRGSPVAKWCTKFESWIESTVGLDDGLGGELPTSQAERDACLVAWQRAPDADVAHPAESPGEHLMPFFFAYGAAGEGVVVRCPHKEYLGSLPMAAYEFCPSSDA